MSNYPVGASNVSREPRELPMVLKMMTEDQQRHQVLPQHGSLQQPGSLALQGAGRGSLALQGAGRGSLAQQGAGRGSLAQQGAGRGRGLAPAGMPVAGGPSVGSFSGSQQYVVQNPSAAEAVHNARQMYQEHKNECEIFSRYVPGLHRPGENFPQLPERRKPTSMKARTIPDDLLKGYQDGSKNPISAIHEFSQQFKLTLDFKEVEAPGSMYSAQFAYQCILDGKTYPLGVARTKKDAKTKSAAVAFDALVAASSEAANYEDIEGAPEAELDDESDEVKTDVEADQYNLGNKHPVMMLYEYCAKKQIPVNVVVKDVLTEYGFECEVWVSGRRVTTQYSTSKKDAKKRAGEEAIRILLADDVPSQTQQENMLHFDIMRELAKSKVEELWKTASFVNVWNAYAAFIVKRTPEHRGEVVAVGTGDKCLLGRSVRCDGRALIDCHAEVIARRALLKWFYGEMRLVFTGKQDLSVFELNADGTKLKLKDCVSIHLYLNNSPCGDASAFPLNESTIMSEEEKRLMLEGLHLPKFTDKQHGQLRVKLELNLTSTPVVRLSDECTFEGLIHGQQQLRTMSCSDKILKWNVVGLQGNLLTHFLEPVYVNSITLGNRFDLGHLVRAVCCRLSEDTLVGNLPEGFREHHPLVGRIAVYDPLKSAADNVQYLSLNWCAEDKLVEVIDSRTGLAIEASPFKTGPSLASRLSKAGFYYRFKTFAKETQQHHLLEFPSYLETKRLAEDYIAVERKLFELLDSSGLGRWQGRLDELESFS